MALWLTRTGRHGEHEARFLKDSRIYLTWRGLKKDLSALETLEEFQALQRETYPHQSAKAVVQYDGQMGRFVREMEPRDWVVVPSKSKSAVHIGEIAGPYCFDAEADDPYYHYRDVRWVGVDIPRSNFDQDLLYSFGAFSTICRIQRNDAEKRVRAMAKSEWKGLAIPPIPTVGIGDAEEAQIHDLEELARDQIAALINQRYKGHGLARLIDAILRAQGYTTHLSAEGQDKGIDILAAPGPLGFGSPRICVQVKSGDSPVDSPTLSQLIGAMQNVRADQGLLVSWGGFKSSVAKEVPVQFFRVRLWDQDAIIAELLANYDRLSDEMRAELPLKRIWAVTVAEDGE